MKNLKVRNLQSTRGNLIANQFEIYCDGKVFFQSYTSLIACVNQNNNVYINKNFYKYSRTTSKYLSIFLGYNSKEIENKIKAGQIKLVDNLDDDITNKYF